MGESSRVVLTLAPTASSLLPSSAPNRSIDRPDGEDLVLDGEADALTLLSISLDGVDLVAGVDYALEGDALTIPSSVLGGDGPARKLATRVEIAPETNTQLSGLYKSGKMYCTQCEAMG